MSGRRSPTPRVVHALLEDADDGEGNSADFEAGADGGIGAAKSLVREQFGHHRALDVGLVVGLVQKAAHRHQQVRTGCSRGLPPAPAYL